MRILSLALAAFTALLSAPCAAIESAKESFERIAALAGHWRGTFANGNTHEIELRTTAGGSVIVETWTLGPGRESMTVYHLDGDRLLATHYCPQGNAPRLARVDADGDGTDAGSAAAGDAGGGAARLRFAFVDGTGLQPVDRSHLHAFWIEARADGTFVRGETYRRNDSDTATVTGDEDTVVYTRIAAAD